MYRTQRLRLFSRIRTLLAQSQLGTQTGFGNQPRCKAPGDLQVETVQRLQVRLFASQWPKSGLAVAKWLVKKEYLLQ